MRYRQFGNTGLFVSELCLGTMTFGGEGEMWSQIGDLQQADADKLVGRAFDAGINFIDTADVYSRGQSEMITGQALKNLNIARDEVVVATKVFGETGPGVNARGLTRYHIMEGVKASLRRLQLDHIDLYQIHGFDPATPIEETVRALDTLVEHGHVRYVGVSNWAAWQIMKALGIAERHGLARFESLQAYYTLAGRDLEREIVPLLQSENLGLMVWSPLAGGLLSGKYGRDKQAEAGSVVGFINHQFLGDCHAVGDTNITHMAMLDQRVEGARRLLDRRGRVEAVDTGRGRCGRAARALGLALAPSMM